MRNFRQVLIGTFLFWANFGLAAAQIVDMRAEYQKGECLPKAGDPKVARFKVVGPGHLEVHLYLDPYWHAGRAAFVPLAWTRYTSPSKSQGWGVLGQMVQGQGFPDHYYQGGKEVGNWIDGVPWEMVSTFDVAAGQYDLGAQIGPPAIHYGCGATQWGQKARLVISFSPGGPGASATLQSISGETTAATATSTTATATSAANNDIVGLWNVNANGYANQLEVTRSGAGYVLRWLSPNATPKTMTNVEFNPATGEIKFTNPLKSQGYPDQMYVGKLEAGKLSGTFGWAPKTTGFLWSAVRAKSTPTDAIPSASNDIAGLWNMNANGYPSQLEVTRSGAGYALRWLSANAPAETMAGVGFNPATGEIKFTRPLKAQGYPDQMYVGRLEAGKLSGTFGSAPKTTGSLWSAVRAK
jgi:hypothetical protein